MARLVCGIERRSAHVYAQGWLRLVPPVRAWAPAVITRTQGRRSGETEAALSSSV